MNVSSMKQFAYDYYEFCKDVAYHLNEEKLSLSSINSHSENKLFKNKSESSLKYDMDKICNFEKTRINYSSNIDYITNTTKYKYPEVVLNFIYFIKECEKCFFYNNDDGNFIFCSVNSINGIYSLTIQFDDYTVIYKLQNSSINIPSEKKYGGALSFMNDNYDEENADTILFANIIVKRNYGENMVSEFKFIQNSSIDFTDKGDEILFDIVNKNIKKVILNSFNDILNNTICNAAGIKIIAEEVLKHANLDVWRC